MDIAKIRKKIKEESELRNAGKEEKPERGAQKQENKPAGDSTSASEKTEAGKQHIEDSIQGEKPQPPEMSVTQAVSESENLAASVLKPARPEKAVSAMIELLTFQLASEEFAFRISEVEEILTPQKITPVPKVPDYILGITSVRGKVMPVLDLKRRLPIKDYGASASSAPPKAEGGGRVRKKILTLKGPNGRIGVMIDSINGVIRIDESEIAEPPVHLSESDLMFVAGVVLYNGRFISVIRLEETVGINLK